MVREHFERPIRNGEGVLQPGCSVRVLEPGTTTPIPDTIWANATGTDPADERSNPWTTDSGIVDFYLDKPQTVRIGVVRPGGIEETYFEDMEVGDAEVYKETFTFTLAGAVATSVGALRFYIDDACEVLRVRAAVGVAPVGASIIVDVNKNGSSIFASQADRPTIADGQNLSTVSPASPISLAEGDYLTLDIDQVGVSTPGAHLVVTVRVRRIN